MKNYNYIALMTLGLLLGACTQSTPSMMNTSKIELVDDTHVEQIPYDKLDAFSMAILADQYSKYGDGPLELTMAYDPSSKTFTAMKARQKLNELEGLLAKKGIMNVKTSTLAMKGESPALMVMYPSVTAQGPGDCDVMPGLMNNETGRFFEDYKFGCSTETLIAKQVARPADLRGRDASGAGPNEGRRIVNVVDTYQTLNSQQSQGSLDTDLALERRDLESN